MGNRADEIVKRIERVNQAKELRIKQIREASKIRNRKCHARQKRKVHDIIIKYNKEHDVSLKREAYDFYKFLNGEKGCHKEFAKLLNIPNSVAYEIIRKSLSKVEGKFYGKG